MTQPSPTPLWQTRKFRIAVLAGIVGLLALTVILQNLERWDIQFLFWNVRTSIAATIFASMLAGAALEMLVRILLRRRKRRRLSARQAAMEQDESED